MQAVFYKRDFSGKLNLPKTLGLQVERYSWHMEGGPEKATIKARATADKWELNKLLRCPVEIYGKNESDPVWWGYVVKVTIPQGEQRFGRGLENMFNHVRVRFESDSITEASSDTVSIAEYGQKETILRNYGLTGLEAGQLRSTELKRSKDPISEVEKGYIEEVVIECVGWYETLRWKHYENTTDSNVETTTQISTIVGDVGQFIQGVLIQDASGVVSNQRRDNRDGLSCVNEILQSGTSNNRPLLSRVDKNRYLHIWERSEKPPAGDVDFILRDDGRLEYIAGGALVPDELCTVAKWVKAKGSPNEYSFFIESAEYIVANDKTDYRAADAYEQRRLAKYIADIVTGDGPHLWSGLFQTGTQDGYGFEPYWVALGGDNDDVTRVNAVAWDENNNLLYVVGEFAKIGDIEAANAAYLDMATGQWYAMGDGLSGIGYAVGVLSDGTVYAGTGGTGHFWEWDGSSWTDLTGGGSGPTNAIYVDVSDNVYLGGAFTSLPGAATAKYAGVYSGAAFTALAGLDWTGGGTGGVYALDSDGSYIYATGKFDNGYAAEWDGFSWSFLGSGLSGVGYAVAVYGNNVAFAGVFDTVEQWDGIQWTSIGTLNIGGAPTTGYGLATDGTNLYLVGTFASTYHCARWDGSEWVSLGGGLTGGTLFGRCITLFDDLHPVIGGDFTAVNAGLIPADGIAMYIVTLEGVFDHLNTRGGSASRPGGPDKAVQYNRDGRFGGEKAFTYDETNDNLILGPYTPPAAGSKTIHQINQGGSPAHLFWAFTNSYAPFIAFLKANGDSTTPTALLADEIIGRIRGRGHDGTNYSSTQMEIRLLAKENWDGSGHGTYFEIYITPENSTTLTKIATIDENGLTVGGGAAGIDYVLTFDGETNDGTVTWMEDEAYFDVSHPVKITDAGSLLGTPVAGTFEFDADRMYLTNVGTQRAIDRTSDVITSTTTVSDTVTETTIWTGTLGANDLKAGNLIKVMTSGVISNATASDDITINVYIGSTQVASYNPAIGNVTGADWHADQTFTVRSVGASGSIAFHGLVNINGNEAYNNSIETVDTTAAEDITVKVQWDNAKAGNTISIYQGFMEFKN